MENIFSAEESRCEDPYRKEESNQNDVCLKKLSSG